MRKLVVIPTFLALAALGAAASFGLAGAETTGTVTACATASVPAQTTPSHSVGVDGTSVHTISGDVIPEKTASHCETVTYTVPTVTETVTTTVTGGSGSNPASYTNGPLGSANPIPADGERFLIDWYGGDGVTYAQMQAGISQREADIGRKFDGIGLHYGGGGTFGGVANCAYIDPAQKQEQWVHDHGALPVVSWSPNATLGEINSGAFDGCYRAVADYLKQYPFPVMLRLMYEFNGNWMKWAVPPNYTGADYVAAWRRIVGLFKGEGATNVGFWWVPSEGQDRAIRDASYPGDEYVDWVGSDGYNHFGTGWDTPLHSGWASFREMFDYTNLGSSAVSAYSKYADRKPFVVGETGTKPDLNVATRKGDWFRNIRTADMPLLRGIQFFDQDVSTSEPGNNWRVDYPASQPDAYAGFKEMATGVAPPPPAPTPTDNAYWHGFTGDRYSVGKATPGAGDDGFATVFESYLTDSRLAAWGGLPAYQYDSNGMSADPAQRVHLTKAIPAPPGASTPWVSRHESREGEPWASCTASASGCKLSKSTVRLLSPQTWNGAFRMGDVRWFSWAFYLPWNQPAGDYFRVALNSFTDLGDLHSADSSTFGGWAFSVQCPCSGWWYTSGPYATGRWLYLSLQGGPVNTNKEVVPFLKFRNDDGSPNLSAYNHWHRVVVGMKASDQGSIGSSPGWLKVYVDGSAVYDKARPTVISGETAPYLDFQNYTQADVDFEGGTSSTVYYADAKAGYTLSDVGGP